MTTKTVEPIDLPAPVAAYFAADTSGAEAVAQCFTDGAVVIDERHEYRGRTAIARWKAEASAKFRYTVDRLGAHVSGNQTTVTGPKNAATLAVPRDCTANNPIRITIVSGTM